MQVLPSGTYLKNLWLNNITTKLCHKKPTFEGKLPMARLHSFVQNFLSQWRRICSWSISADAVDKTSLSTTGANAIMRCRTLFLCFSASHFHFQCDTVTWFPRKGRFAVNWNNATHRRLSALPIFLNQCWSLWKQYLQYLLQVSHTIKMNCKVVMNRLRLGQTWRCGRIEENKQATKLLLMKFNCYNEERRHVAVSCNSSLPSIHFKLDS